MNSINRLLPEKTRNDLRQEAFIADQQNALTPTQWKIIQENNWINIWLPKELGGNDFDFPTIVKTLYELAWTDGSLGWTVTLCSGANWFAGFIKNGKEVFNTSANIWAGSGQTNGILTPTEEGFILNGQWQYATGIEKATHITFNAKMKNSNEVVSGYLYPHQIRLLHTWNKMGMRGTGTHNFAVDNILLSPEQLFKIDQALTTHPGKVFQIPFNIMAMATLAVNYGGMVEHFWEEAHKIAEAENKHVIADKIQGYQFALEQTMSKFYQRIDDIWTKIQHDIVIEEKTSVSFITSCKEIIKEQYRNIHELFPHLGMHAVDAGSMINLIWRDLHTASQHAMWRS